MHNIYNLLRFFVWIYMDMQIWIVIYIYIYIFIYLLYIYISIYTISIINIVTQMMRPISLKVFKKIF